MSRALALLLVLFAATNLRAQPKPPPDLAAQVAALEKRVAALEAALKKAPAADPTKTEVANKVVGNWIVADDTNKDAVFTDLVLKADGTCQFVARVVGPRPTGTYQVIGKQIVVMSGVETWSNCRVTSVTDKELVLEHPDGETVKKIKYIREK